jgi:hypothetical protein
MNGYVTGSNPVAPLGKLCKAKVGTTRRLLNFFSGKFGVGELN